MGVDDRPAHGRARDQTEFLGRARSQPTAQRSAHRADRLADTPEVLRGQIPEADLLEKFAAPSGAVPTTLAEVGPLTDRATKRAGLVPGRAVGEKIGQIEKPRRPLPARGQMLFQPKQFRHFHLGGNDSAHVAQHRVAGAVDPLRLLERAMIHPDHDILLGPPRRAHRHRTVFGIKRDERTGGIETDALDRGRLETRAAQSRTGRPYASAPDIFTRLLDVIGRRVPELNRK